MKNPLNKRFLRELKGDIGKYAVIFLFLTLLTSIVSSFILVDDSVYKTYNEGFTKYNVEDGHITFSACPPDGLLDKLETENDITFYNLYYKNETDDATGATLRIYTVRDTVDTECVLEGALPSDENEIALDRLYAENHEIKVGDTITVRGNEFTVSGYIALVDYNCLYENNSDMMFDAITFGVAETTAEGFNRLNNSHLYYNYAWKYNTAPADETEENEKSEAIVSSLKDILTDYDESLVQAQVDDLWAEAKTTVEKLKKEITDASTVIESKTTAAGTKAAEKAISALTTDEMMSVITAKSGKTETQLILSVIQSSDLNITDIITLIGDKLTKSDEDMMNDFMSMTGKSEEDMTELILSAAGLTENDISQELMNKALEKSGKTLIALTAEELGTTEEALNALSSAMSSEGTDATDFDFPETAPQIDFDAIEDGEDYSTGLDYSFDDFYAILDKIDATGLYDTTAIRADLASLEKLADFEIDESSFLNVSGYIPNYENQGIHFTGNDMEGDKSTFTLFYYILVIILAFVFAVTTSNTIMKEAGVIGTLRASGYTKGELVRHYMVLPMIVSLLAAAVGNVLGYTLLEKPFVSVYFTNYSLATYESSFSKDALIKTTVVPLIMMFVINLLVLTVKMRTPALSFLRGETGKRKRKRAVALPEKLPFMNRFGLRVFFRNIPAYITLFFGIFLGGTIVVFGIMFGPLLKDYSQLVKDTHICEYQYVLTDDKEVENTQAEKYCVTTLDTMQDGYITDSVMIYGITGDSAYITADIPEGEVLISNGFAEKFSISAGDTVTLKESYSTDTYSFKVAGIYTYDAAISVFMPREDWLSTFDMDDDYFTGYFSNEELTDLTEDDIATLITDEDLTKIVTQMEGSMSGMMSMMKYLGIVIFIMLMFMLVKQIIDRDSMSISMTKILGFSNGEAGRIYLVVTSVVVLISLLVSVPVISVALRWVFKVYMYTEVSGYIPYIIANSCYVKMVLLGILSYAVVFVIMLFKIKRIPKGQVLKNQIV